MNRPDIEPSLRPAEPLLDSLDDGFSPPADAQSRGEQDIGQGEPADLTLVSQSPF
ncbi:hypothetical protein [Ramlibacter montanisoli]|uniref:Uncharacterized protein n=1 Tax=Ramlibacter montanisoli TaxID=2732512 RepID=A0A849KBQ5_9BURK|nr:hypothetical protein [Ramlibacter montanisoli]NNU43894.1 hypothetical protein [Ramlibacter montanisoli]